MNLRGIRESGTFFAIPTYAFMVAILGDVRLRASSCCVAGDLPEVESADAPDHRGRAGYEGDASRRFALLFLLARAFSSGCAALTGVEAISNGVPAFRRPKSRNAATTLLLLGLIAITMMLSVIVAGQADGPAVRRPARPRPADAADGSPLPGDYDQHTADRPDRRRRLRRLPAGLLLRRHRSTGIILVLAANTAFNGFPVLGSILAKDGYAPRALGSRGDRLAYSNGIVFLAVMAIVLIRRLRRRGRPG